MPPRGTANGMKKRLRRFSGMKVTRLDGSCIVLQRVLRPFGRTCLSGSTTHDPSRHSRNHRTHGLDGLQQQFHHIQRVHPVFRTCGLRAINHHGHAVGTGGRDC